MIMVVSLLVVLSEIKQSTSWESVDVATQGKENLTPGFCEGKTVNLKEHKPQQKLHTLAEAK